MTERNGRKMETKPGRYRHYKGGEYEVLGLVRHSETEELMVVYRALYGEGGYWVRPACMWNETVCRNGVTCRRFTPIETQEERKMLFVYYPKCSTCQKARAFLEAQGADVVRRDIKTENPTVEELRAWWEKSGLPLKKFFNTSGLQYKALGLKERLPGMSEEEKLALLATDGMLVKRPLLVGEDFVLTGFRPGEWEAALKK